MKAEIEPGNSGNDMLNDHAYTLNVGNQRIAQARRGVSYTNTVDLVNREYEQANKFEQQVK